MRASTFAELGGFTDELFLYGEDLELAWRARMKGLRVVMNPRADVFHAYEFSRNVSKRYFLERNRLVFVLSAFSRADARAARAGSGRGGAGDDGDRAS